MLLRICNQDHNFIGYIRKIRDLCVTSSVEDGSEELTFTYLAKHHHLDVEYYLLYDSNEYVIKQMQESSDGFPTFTAVLNKEDLWAKDYKSFSVKDSTIYDAARLACTGTRWRVYEPDASDPAYISKKRNAGMLDVRNADDVLQKLCTAFMVEIQYNCKEQIIYFYEHRGSDRGVYFKDGLNLRKLKRTRDTYDLYTRIRPVGSNNLSIAKLNDGLEYLEDKTYSSKSRTYVWEASDYTDAQALMDDAKLMLADISRPVDSYEVDVVDLAAQNPKYSLLSYELGDTVRMIDSRTGIATRQRIVKLTRYPDHPEKNKAEISSPVLRFTDLSEKYRAAYEIINTVVANDGRYTGTINVSDILHFEDGVSGSATIGNLSGKIEEALAEIGTLKVNKISAEEADIRYATIANLEVVSERVKTIDGDYASFKSTVTDELAAHTGQIDDLQVAKGWMLDASIGDAQIANVSANKLTAGTVDTAIVTVQGSDGRLSIQDNTILIRDLNHARVQVGRDASGDYSLTVWDAAGNLIWDALGATADSIQRPIIRDEMVSDDAAISGSKLDIASVVTAVNNGTTAISTTIIKSGNKTLDVLLQEQTQEVADYGSRLSTAESRITATETGLESKVSSSVYTDSQDAIYKQMNDLQTQIRQSDSGILLGVNKSLIDKASSLIRGTGTNLLTQITATREEPLPGYDAFSVSGTSGYQETGEQVWFTMTCTAIVYRTTDGAFRQGEWTRNEDIRLYSVDNGTATLLTTFSWVLDRWVALFKASSLPESYRIEFGGRAEGRAVYLYPYNIHVEQGNYTMDWYVADRIESYGASISVDVDSIRSEVSSVRSDMTDMIQDAKKTVMEQTDEKFSWLVSSGTSSTDFTLTDRMAQLITDQFVISDRNGNTIISGGRIDTDKIFAANIEATGTIKGLHIEGGTGDFGGLYASADTTYIKRGYNYMRFGQDVLDQPRSVWAATIDTYVPVGIPTYASIMDHALASIEVVTDGVSDSSKKYERGYVRMRGTQTSQLAETISMMTRQHKPSYDADSPPVGTADDDWVTDALYGTVSSQTDLFKVMSNRVQYLGNEILGLEERSGNPGDNVSPLGVDAVSNSYGLVINRSHFVYKPIDVVQRYPYDSTTESKMRHSDEMYFHGDGRAGITCHGGVWIDSDNMHLGVSPSGISISFGGNVNDLASVSLGVGIDARFDRTVYYNKLTQLSDRRFKSHISYMADNRAFYDRLLQCLRPAVYYRDDERQYGLYAQDVRESLLEAGEITGMVTASLEDGRFADMTTAEEDATYSLDYIETIPLLINGWQSHHSRIAELEEQVRNLQLQLDDAYTQINKLQNEVQL